MRNLLLIALILLAAPSFAQDCSDNKVTRELCETIDEAEACLFRGKRNCKDVDYVAGELVVGLLYLGKVEGGLLGLSTDGPVDGDIATKVRFFKMGFHNPSWYATSVDGNWIAAVNQANRSIRDAMDRIDKLIK
jgi:hypothetical protein